MLIREILTENKKVDEAPVGMIKRGLAKLGAKLGSQKLKGYGDLASMANALYKDVEQWMGRSGLRQVDADALMASPIFQGDQIMPGILKSMNADQGPINKAVLQKAMLTYAKEYNRTGGTVAQTPGAAPAGAAGPAGPTLAKDVEVVNADPMILRYRNKDFMLGDRGEWLDAKTNKPVPQSFQAFLNQQADIADQAIASTPTAATPDSVSTPSGVSRDQNYKPATTDAEAQAQGFDSLEQFNAAYAKHLARTGQTDPRQSTRTGGKVAGTVSMTPNAIRKRAARAAQSAKI